MRYCGKQSSVLGVKPDVSIEVAFKYNMQFVLHALVAIRHSAEPFRAGKLVFGNHLAATVHSKVCTAKSETHQGGVLHSRTTGAHHV